MNNRNVFQASSKVKSGIDSKKCLALINAAWNGETEEVVRLASDPEVDIDFIGFFSNPENPYNEYHSAISAAFIRKHSQIVLFLLQQKAKVDQPSSGYYYLFTAFQSILSIACVKPSDLNLFKPLLRATKMPNHEFNGWHGNGSLIKFLITRERDLTDKSQRISLFFHELVLRNDTKSIHEFLTLDRTIHFDVLSCQEYLIDIELTTEQAFRAAKGINYLAEIEFISKDTCRQILDMIGAKTKYTLELEAFPLALQKSLSIQSKRSLHELSAELQHWLLPDEGLPPGLIDSVIVKATSDHSDEELKTIRKLQSPKMLRQYAELDPSEFLTMLYDSISPKGENPAAELLAEILMYHKKDLLDDGKPLFDSEQEKKYFLILKRLYNLTESEKLTLISHRKHREEVRELKYENAVLKNELDDNKAKMKDLEAKFDALQKLVMKLSTPRDDMNTTPPSSPSLFRAVRK